MKKAVLVLGAYLIAGLLLCFIATKLPGQTGNGLGSWTKIIGILCIAVPLGSILGLLLIVPHELGHIYVAKRLGYRLAWLQILGFKWMESHTGFRFQWGLDFYPPVHRSHYKENPDLAEIRKILLAGPIASVGMAVLFSPLLLWPQTKTVGIVIVGAYLLYAFSSFIGTEDLPSDGNLLRHIKKDPAGFLKNLQVHYDQIVEWQRPKSYNEKQLLLNGNGDYDAQIHMYLYWKYMDMGDIGAAEPHIRAALDFAISGCKGRGAIEAAYEAAVFYRRFRPDTELAGTADILALQLSPDYDKSKIIDGAKLWVSGEKEAAKATWKVFADEFEARQKRPGDIAHGRDWFLRLCTEDMVFETGRLFARTWRSEDLEQLVSIYVNPNVRHFLSPQQPATREEIEAKLSGRLEDQHNFETGLGAWALVRKEDEKLIGAVFADRHEDGEIEIAWHLGQDFWGKGYGTEAAIGLKSYVFAKLPDVSKLRAVVHPANAASRNIAKKINMKSFGQSDVHYGVMLEVFEIVR